MIINNSLNNNQPNTKSSPKFRGLIDSGFKFLADEPVWGLTGVDLTSMVFPRTATDIKHRGAQAGFETGFREAESSGNDALIGCYGVLAGSMIASGINKKHEIKANKIFASDDAIDVYTQKWKQNNGNIDTYTKDIIDSIRAYNPTSEHADPSGYVKVPETHKQGLIDDLKYIASGDIAGMDTRWKDRKNNILTKLIDATGVENQYKLVNGEKKTYSTSKTMMENFYAITRALKSDKVKNNVETFVGDYKKFGKKRTAIGMSIAAFFALIAQPLNVYISKKKTGTDGFVGVEGRKKDNSTKIKIVKGVTAMGMMGLTLATLGALSKNPLKIPAKFIEKNQYKGKNPTMNQFISVFGLAISSRILTSRDFDEWREVNTKDVLGFFNWLLLGSVVNKIILHKFQDKDANMLKKPPVNSNKGFIYEHIGDKGRKLMNFLSSSIASHTEVVVNGLKKERPDIKSLIKADGTAMTYKEMRKLLPKDGQARKNLRLLNWAQFGGYLYSGLVLGIGIPMLNIKLTNHFDKKRKAKLAEEQLNNKQINVVNEQIKSTAFGRLKASA